MAIAKMRYVNVHGPDKELWSALSVIAKSDSFAPEKNEEVHSTVQLATNSYEPLLTKAKGLLKELGQESFSENYDDQISKYTLQQVGDYLGTFTKRIEDGSKRKIEIETEIQTYEKAKSVLVHMDSFNASMDQIFSLGYLKIRFGRLPKNSFVRLSYYIEKSFDFTSYFDFLIYDFDGDYYWGMYFVPGDKSKEIDDIFASLYFERMWVPEFVHGTPAEALAGVNKKLDDLNAEKTKLTTSDIATPDELSNILDMASWLYYCNQLYDMQKYALIFNNSFYISGFVPVDEYSKFKKTVEQLSNISVSWTDNTKEMPEEPPIKLKNNALVRPYEMYVKMYGLPRYGDIDPTSIIAITYSILYGLMFADLGQGLVLGLFAHFFMYKKKHLPLGQILSRASIFCCIFGILFGSVFGFEHVTDSIWGLFGMKNMSLDVMAPSSIGVILYGSIGIGVVVISMAIFMGIYSKFKRGLIGDAIVSPNGVAGFVFYLSVIALILDKLVFKIGFSSNIFYMIFLIILPIVVMYFAHPLEQLIDGKKVVFEDGLGNYLITAIFEMFVTMLEYLSNTISFLRVGGFILAHAGMMMAVMTLSEMFPVAKIPIIILGNIFVIALEGLLVGIQALRLDYYEVFSHFYDAEGTPFEPLDIKKETIKL